MLLSINTIAPLVLTTRTGIISELSHFHFINFEDRAKTCLLPNLQNTHTHTQKEAEKQLCYD